MRHDALVPRTPAPSTPRPTFWLLCADGTTGHVPRQYLTGRRVPRTLCGHPLRADARLAEAWTTECRICARIVTGSW